MNISVFGGSQPREGTPAYEEARLLGELLAQRGHIVLTGGYIGTMEAVWRKVSANKWVKEERRKKSLMERLQALIEDCDAAIALPGGPGTLTEIALTWNLMIVESRHRIPLILVGGGWQSTFDQFFREFHTYMPIHQRDLLQFAPDVKSAVEMLDH
jgi:predicted Rossmann-fold nucleotide-binding protein